MQMGGRGGKAGLGAAGLAVGVKTPRHKADRHHIDSMATSMASNQRNCGPGTSEATRVAMEDGLQVYVKRWSVADAQQRRGVIVFNHGFSEHIDAYDQFFQNVTQYGFDVVGYDQRGSGKTSPNKKTFGNTNDYHVFSDLETILNEVVKQYPSEPVVLWGHSMGGAITLNYGVFGRRRNQLAAYMADAPLIEVHPNAQAPKLLTALIPLIAKIYPKYKSKVNLADEYLTDDKEKIEEYKRDPLRLKLTTAEMARDFLNRGKKLTEPAFVRKFADRPVLVSHGTGDLVNNYQGSVKFFEALQVKDKQFNTYEGWLHELAHMTKPKREEHCERVMEWLIPRVAQPVEPVEPVEPVREPVEPVREPVREPVEPVREPVEPVRETVEPVEPVEPVSEPVREPVTEPVEPTREPISEPVEPISEPIRETVQEPKAINTVDQPEIAPVEPFRAKEVELVKETVPLEHKETAVTTDSGEHAAVEHSKKLEVERVEVKDKEAVEGENTTEEAAGIATCQEPIVVREIETETAAVRQDDKDLIVQATQQTEVREDGISKQETFKAAEVVPEADTIPEGETKPAEAIPEGETIPEAEVIPEAETIPETETKAAEDVPEAETIPEADTKEVTVPETEETAEAEVEASETDKVEEDKKGEAKPSSSNKKKNKKKKKKGKR